MQSQTWCRHCSSQTHSPSLQLAQICLQHSEKVLLKMLSHSAWLHAPGGTGPLTPRTHELTIAGPAQLNQACQHKHIYTACWYQQGEASALAFMGKAHLAAVCRPAEGRQARALELQLPRRSAARRAHLRMILAASGAGDTRRRAIKPATAPKFFLRVVWENTSPSSMAAPSPSWPAKLPNW